MERETSGALTTVEPTNAASPNAAQLAAVAYRTEYETTSVPPGRTSVSVPPYHTRAARSAPTMSGSRHETLNAPPVISDTPMLRGSPGGVTGLVVKHTRDGMPKPTDVFAKT